MRVWIQAPSVEMHQHLGFCWQASVCQTGTLITTHFVQTQAHLRVNLGHLVMCAPKGSKEDQILSTLVAQGAYSRIAQNQNEQGTCPVYAACTGTDNKGWQVVHLQTQREVTIAYFIAIETTQRMFWKHTFGSKELKGYVLKTYFSVNRSQKLCSENILFNQKGTKSAFWKQTFPSIVHKEYVLKTDFSVNRSQRVCFQNIPFSQQITKSMFWKHTFQSKGTKSMFWKHTFQSTDHKEYGLKTYFFQSKRHKSMFWKHTFSVKRSQKADNICAQMVSVF